MKNIIASRAFQRDLQKMKRRGKNISKIEMIVELLAKGEALEGKHRPHPLKGDWKPYWDCHIEPDWLLIYEVDKHTVKLARTGTHSDLF